jgi:hypothetical protein
MGCSVEEEKLDVGETEKVEAARLVHLPPSVPPTKAGHSGAARAPKLPASTSTATEREMGRGMMSRRLLGMV